MTAEQLQREVARALRNKQDDLALQLISRWHQQSESSAAAGRQPREPARIRHLERQPRH